MRDRDRSAIRVRLKAPPLRIPAPTCRFFAARVQREASRRGFTEGLRQVVLGDGSTWIWNTATELFPQAALILDRFHAKEHLGEVGKVIYGDSPEGKAWIDARCEELDEGHLKSLVHALRSHIGQHKQARECIQYIWRNRRRMRYPQFEKQGFCTSTGVVESGCKVVVGTRLKRAGMHWTVKGANAIIALRCSKLSGRFQDFLGKPLRAKAGGCMTSLNLMCARRRVFKTEFLIRCDG